VGGKIALENKTEQNMVLVELEKAAVFDEFDIFQDADDNVVCETVTKIIKEFMPFIKLRTPERESEGNYD